ncbi:amino acid ABC transporter permease [Pelagibacterium mangrovi]|uniref:amino acid ABC transporter permease n=1 Tax=Pelagibacterium mangrovi TaxID=3119828 RepID=UPI002FC8DBF7
MTFQRLLDELPFLLAGLGIALQLLVALLAFGLVLGLALALLSVYGGPTLRLLTTLFERTFRGIPEIILLMLFFYGVGEYIPMSAFGAAVVALGLRSAAYQSQIFRTSIQATDTGEVMAGRALGMSGTQVVAKIVLPQALRRSIGAWTNEYSSELKATSLAFVIGVVELTRQASYIISSLQGSALAVMTVVAAFYFIVNALGNAALYALERKLAIPGAEQGELS